MNCEQVKQALDTAFDEGAELESSAADHLEICVACAAYGDSLAAVDASLRLAPVVQPAPALVARIQAEIATQPRQAIRPWAYPVGVAAAVMILAALGPVVNGMSWITVMEPGAWLTEEPILPEWDFLWQELTSIPVGVSGDLAAFGKWWERAWASVNGGMAGFTRGYSLWVWTLFLLCAAAACALDGMEWMSRRVRRTER